MMDVRDAIQNGRYKNTVPFGLPMPALSDDMTVRQQKLARVEFEGYNREQRQAHYAEERRLRELFKADLEESNGLSEHTKRDKLFALGWDRGHSGGYEEVASAYEEMAELLK